MSWAWLLYLSSYPAIHLSIYPSIHLSIYLICTFMIMYGHCNTFECVSSYLPPFISHVLLDQWPSSWASDSMFNPHLEEGDCQWKSVAVSIGISGTIQKFGIMYMNTYVYSSTKYLLQSSLWLYGCGRGLPVKPGFDRGFLWKQSWGQTHQWRCWHHFMAGWIPKGNLTVSLDTYSICTYIYIYHYT